jgi:hypothetical protein
MDDVVTCISPKNWSNSLHLWLNFESVIRNVIGALFFSFFTIVKHTTYSVSHREREFLFFFFCKLLSTGNNLKLMEFGVSQDRKHTSKTGSTRFFSNNLVFFLSSSHFPSVDWHKKALHLYRRKSKLYSEMKWWPSKAHKKK